MFGFHFRPSKMERSISFVLFSFSMFFIDSDFFFRVHASQSIHGTTKYKLIHRHSPELQNFRRMDLGPPTNSRERMKQLMRSDRARLQTIPQRPVPRRKNAQVEMAKSNNLVELPIRSAADIGTGQYFVSFRVGSPPRKFIMIMDTGSSLTWMKCKYKCRACFKDRVSLHERIFNAKSSRTFRPIPCSSDICKQDLARSFSLQHCPRPSDPCSYDYRYSDGSTVLGLFGNDTAIVRLANGQKVKVPDVIIGCSETILGEFHDIDGVMGLGFEWHSFAVKAAKKFGHKFSYCLVDHLSPSNLVNFLVFGEVNDPTMPKFQYTELILGIVNPFYAVNVSGISIDGIMLDIPPHVWDVKRGGGVIVDSGFSLTQLVKPVFDRVVAAFDAPFSKFKRLPRSNEGPEICFDDTGYKESMMPKLVIHFGDGAKLTPPVKSYVLDAAEGEKCLGFTSTPWPGSMVIGNILQQNHLWEFDLLNSKLGFAPSTCIFES
ncbi:NANA [Hibiscus trionum]|uniref:NANA n=2 Tax=Hibiscus trionum TaxID=183268 RepID=A0A9W7H9F7_HIBTR|nr:NANA [Hibiscus trionum]